MLSRIALLFCLILSFGFVAESQAESITTTFKQARLDYKELLKSDPRVSSLLAWERVATQLRSVALNKSNKDVAARAAFLVAYLSEHQFRILKLQIFLSRSISFYKFIAREFPKHELVDDSLLLLGDIYRFNLKQEARARASYLELLKVSPDGDMNEKAKQRLAEIRSVEVPLDLGGIITGFFSKTKNETRAVDNKIVFERKYSIDRPLVVVDPGHGGVEDGALGHGGLWEKDLVLSLSFRLEKLIQQKLRARVLLTRRSDIDVPLSGRTKLANDKHADLFLSVHANASVRKTASGIETYYLDNTNDASSLRLAARENRAFQRESDDLSFILSDLIQNAKLEDSISFAHEIQNQLVGTLSAHYSGVNDLGVKKAPFFVLVGAHMPCALAEVSFIDHPVEGKRLTQARYQELVSQALYRGVRDYFNRN